MTKKKLFMLISAVSAVMILVSLIAMMLITPATKKKQYTTSKIDSSLPLRITTEFTLKDSENKNLSSQTLRGQFLLIYFGSTDCYRIFLPSLAKLKNLTSILEKQQEKNAIKLIFITVNPAQDTAQHLKEYFQKADLEITPLTGTKQQIDRVLKNFRAYQLIFGAKTHESHHNIEAHMEQKKIEQTQCSRIAASPFYFIGKDGKLIKTYSPYTESLSLAKDIAHYLRLS